LKWVFIFFPQQQRGDSKKESVDRETTNEDEKKKNKLTVN